MKIKFSAASILLVALVFLTASCGNTVNRSVSKGRMGEASTVERPDFLDSAGWFPYSGPTRLDQYEDVPFPSGLGIVTVLPIGSYLLASDSIGFMHAYSEKTGILIPLGKQTVEGDPSAMTADLKQFYVADSVGAVHAFPVSDNPGVLVRERVWSAHPGMIADWILAVPGYIVCVSAGGTICILSAFDGAVQSFRDLGTPLFGKPVAAGSVLVIARVEGLVALSTPNLEFLWSGDRAPFETPVLRTVRNQLAFQDLEGTFRVLDARTGTELYSLPSAKGSIAVGDGERWYIAGPNGGIGAYRITDGVPVWTVGAAAKGGTRSTGSALSPPRIVVEADHLFVANLDELESWNSKTGELIERTKIPSPVDGLYITPGRLYCRMRDGLFRVFGAGLISPFSPDPEGSVKPDPAVSELICKRLERYAESESSIQVAWRVYIPGSVPSPDYRFTVFRYEVQESGKKGFFLSPADRDPIFVGVFDATGSERRTNVGELGVDASFEYWMDKGTWYIAFGNLRGKEASEPLFLEIR